MKTDKFKSNVIASFDLSTTSLKDYENWTVQIFYAKLANDDNSVVWNEIEVPPFALNADKDAYVAKTKEALGLDPNSFFQVILFYYFKRLLEKKR